MVKSCHESFQEVHCIFEAFTLLKVIIFEHTNALQQAMVFLSLCRQNLNLSIVCTCQTIGHTQDVLLLILSAYNKGYHTDCNL